MIIKNAKKPTWYYVGGFFFLTGVIACIFNPISNYGLLITYAVLSIFFFYIANKKNQRYKEQIAESQVEQISQKSASETVFEKNPISSENEKKTIEIKSRNNVKAIFGTIVFIAIIWFYFGGGFDSLVSKQMGHIENQVAEDAVKQYEIAKRGGDKMQTYVQASLVAAAYLQAKDEINYNKWKEIEKQEALNAGVSIP